MTTQAEVDRLAREVAELRAAVLAKRYGVQASQLVLVLGGEAPEAAVARRLERVPEELRRRIKVRTVALPYLTTRTVGTGATA